MKERDCKFPREEVSCFYPRSVSFKASAVNSLVEMMQKLTLLLSVLQLQLLHHLHKAVNCGGLGRNGARVETGHHFPRDFTVSSFHV